MHALKPGIESETLTELIATLGPFLRVTDESNHYCVASSVALHYSSLD